MKTTELFYEPMDTIMPLIDCPKGEPEMSRFDSGFLCGLIRDKKPHKLVELGVAGGGTTAILLQCLKDLGLQDECKMYSLDYLKMFYRDNTKPTGYLGLRANEIIKNKNHKFMLGSVMPDFIDEIVNDGRKIDFIIMDTAHRLPGELLDFIGVLPYLEDGAVVVFHDIVLNHFKISSRYSMCTKLVLDTAVGDKVFVSDKDKPENFPNIAALIVNDETRKYIINSFSALSLSWEYLPPNDELDKYHEWYLKNYSSEYVKFFDASRKLNEKALRHRSSFYERFKMAARAIIKGY